MQYQNLISVVVFFVVGQVEVNHHLTLSFHVTLNSKCSCSRY